MRYENLSRHASLFSEYTELRVQENTAASATSVNGDIVNNVQTKTSGVSARAFKDGVWGFASSPVRTEQSIASSVKRATENVKFLAKKREQTKKSCPLLPAVDSTVNTNLQKMLLKKR
ncbi:PmbA/TldA family metallopeptidase [Treponema pedis]|uniref:PmbA/TldA family metallopeptidase n=1 Tax=Treponema pedis TaxID=409322 RepID=UPI002090DFB3|nr:DNA gyrase modulator [Treponema pedis]